MKKLILFLVVCVTLTLTSCGSGSATNEVKDSTEVSVDTLMGAPTDSVGVPVGGGGSGEDLPVRPKENVK